jgi:hypothetical protein
MGNRTAVGLKEFKSSANTLIVYLHWSNYENGISDAYAPLVHARKRWGDTFYANRMAISSLIRDDIDGELGVGISINDVHWIDYDEYAVIVWMENVVVINDGKTHSPLAEYTFDKYIELYESRKLMADYESARKLADKQFSHGTLNPRHLLEASLEYLTKEDVLQEVRTELAKPQLTEQFFVLSALWDDVVFDELSSMAPLNHYFGPTEGDGSDIGWWPIVKEGNDE